MSTKKNNQPRASQDTKPLIFIFLALGLLFFSCNKRPSADFTSDQSNYTAGDIVKLTNKSLEAKKYTWTFFNGQTSNSKNTDFTIPENTASGVYPIKLEATTRFGNKKSDTTKYISVTAAQGELTIWSANPAVISMWIKVDNIGVGDIRKNYFSDPGCAAPGCLTANYSVGTHSISATDGTLTLTGTVLITKNTCITFQLK